jgi:tRNA (cmo5U34)-methyltransferase
MSEKDTLFETGDGDPGGFVFDERVVRVFPDMIARSVPGYALVPPMTGLLARRYAQAGSCLYDLGCSLGASTLAMRTAVAAPNTRILAVDNSPAMVRRCRELVEQDPGEIPVEVLEADLRDVRVENASVVVLNFTLQFVDPRDRLGALEGVRAGLRDGGVLVLSEKICFDDPRSQALQENWHHDYKRAKGYTELEISGKRSALEKVLRADGEARHRERLSAAGFSRVERWFQCFSFCSYVAFR